MKTCMNFRTYDAFPSSDVPKMVDKQNSWNSLVIGTYLLYLAWNVGMLAVNICILWPPTVVCGLSMKILVSKWRWRSLPCRRLWFRCCKLTPLLGRRILGLLSRCELRMPRICWLATTILRNTMPTKGFGVGDSITFLSWLGWSASPGRNPLCRNASLLSWCRLQCQKRLRKRGGARKVHPAPGIGPLCKS
jgi:hypothetical protein